MPALGVKPSPGASGSVTQPLTGFGHAVEQRLADAPAAEMKLDAPAVGHAGVEMHVEVRVVAAHLELDVERLREPRRVQPAGEAADVAHVGLRDVDGLVA